MNFLLHNGFSIALFAFLVGLLLMLVFSLCMDDFYDKDSLGFKLFSWVVVFCAVFLLTVMAFGITFGLVGLVVS